MDAILNPRNGASITNTIGVTASGIHPFQENEQPNDFNDIFVPQTSFSIAEPIEFQMGELGYNIAEMYHLTGIIRGEKVLGFESIFNYANENLLAKMAQQ